jgi:hypothetical protein
VRVVNADGPPRLRAIFGARTPASTGGAPIAWRPDGRQLAFMTDRARWHDGTYRIVRVSADGSVRPGPTRARSMAWSPDGRYYAYMTEPPTWRDPRFLVIARAADGRRMRSVRLGDGDSVDWYR